MNTRINYIYRDAENFKQYCTLTVSGEVTFEEMRAFFHENEFFVPSQVGLPDLQPCPFTIHDHIWHEIIKVQPTSYSPTTDIDSIGLINRFRIAQNNGWNETEVYRQKGLL